MTRKYVLIFIFSTIFLFTLASGIFGEQGYLRNVGLKRQLEQQQHQEELLRLQVHSLERRKAAANSVDELRDAALRLGYNQDGNQVFYFSDDTSTQDDAAIAEQPYMDEISVFPGIPTIVLAGISVGGGAFIVLLILVIHHVRIRKFRKDGDDRGGYYEF